MRTNVLQGGNMCTPLIALCGLNCSECEAYIATQANDIETLTRLSDQANHQYNLSLTWEDSQCDGCITIGGRLIGYCSQCSVRQCAAEHEVVNCAYCPEYGCATITQFFEMAPEAKTNLDFIRSNLS